MITNTLYFITLVSCQLHPVVSPHTSQRWQVPFCRSCAAPQLEHFSAAEASRREGALSSIIILGLPLLICSSLGAGAPFSSRKVRNSAITGCPSTTRLCSAICSG